MACSGAPALILDASASFDAVATQMVGPASAAIGKLGTIEFQIAYYRWMTRKQSPPPLVPEAYLLPLCRNAGMFPPTQETATAMADLLLRSVMELTAVSPWWKPQEEFGLYSVFNRTATKIALQSLECFLSPNPHHWWTAQLPVGTRVLVISPFSSTIEQQVTKLDNIWRSRPGLWAQGLQFKCIPFPLSFGTQSSEGQASMLTKYGDSFGLLAAVQAQMDATEYDVAIVGVGIHSLPLVAHAKRQGKRAIHTGGGTQIYFGIRGGRWDTMAEFQPFFNEHWVRPSAEERPPGATAVEGGCYW
jgi:hypothetical protein